MNNIIPSVLHVVASGDLNIEKDLASEQTKTIAQLIEQNEKKEDKS
jgi:hypothetical protein